MVTIMKNFFTHRKTIFSVMLSVNILMIIVDIILQTNIFTLFIISAFLCFEFLFALKPLRENNKKIAFSFIISKTPKRAFKNLETYQRVTFFFSLFFLIFGILMVIIYGIEWLYKNNTTNLHLLFPGILLIFQKSTG